MSEGKPPLRVAISRSAAAGSGTGNAAALSMARLDTFCRALGRSLERPVLPVGVDDYEKLAADFIAGQVELAWLPPAVALTVLWIWASPATDDDTVTPTRPSSSSVWLTRVA